MRPFRDKTPKPLRLAFAAIGIGALILPTFGYEVVSHATRREVTATVQSVEVVQGAKGGPDWYLIRTDGPKIAIVSSQWEGVNAEQVVGALPNGRRFRFQLYGFDGWFNGVYLKYADSSPVDDTGSS